jgi:hypothetical protein
MKSLSIGVLLTAWYSLILAPSLCMFGGVSSFAQGHSIHATFVVGLHLKLEGVPTIIRESAARGGPHLKMNCTSLLMGWTQRGEYGSFCSPPCPLSSSLQVSAATG